MGAPILAFGMFWASKFLVARYGISQGEVARYSFFPPLAFDPSQRPSSRVAHRNHSPSQA